MTAEFSLLAPVDGVAVPIEDLPDPVFAQKMIGDGISIDPTSGKLFAPCAATVTQVHRANHAITLKTDDGLAILIHIGLDTVTLGGRGFRVLVSEGTRVAARQQLVEFDLDVIASAKSAVTEMVITEGAERLSFKRTTGIVAAGTDEVIRISARSASASAPTASAATHSVSVTIRNPNGLHARPAARIVQCARGFDARLVLIKANRTAQATSVTEIMELDLAFGDEVRIDASGPSAQQAADALKALVDSGLGEADSPPQPTPAEKRFVSSDPRRIGGVPAAGGIALGRIFVKAPTTLPDFPATSDTPKQECERLDAALRQVLEALADERDASQLRAETEKAEIFSAHVELLSDAGFRSETINAIENGASVPAAWRAVIDARVERLGNLKSSLMRQRRDDLKDVGQRVLFALLNVRPQSLPVASDTVILAEELTPSDVANLEKANVAAIVSAQGGSTSHAAIIARAKAIPYVAGIGEAWMQIKTGTSVCVDGDQGFLQLEPSREEVTTIEQVIRDRQTAEVTRLAAAQQPVRTRDGHRVEIAANIGNRREAQGAVDQGADGVGLLRSEFLFLSRRRAPTEDEQGCEFEEIGKILGPKRPLVVRTLDVGGDKPLAYMPVEPEENPFLGIRGLRLSLRYPDLFSSQIRAILRAAAHTRLHIMFPMVAKRDEFLRAKELVLAEAKSIQNANIALGVMIEVPSAALMADVLAKEVDFFSIGTNDLTQYTLAMDRGHAELAAEADALDPSVLRLIKMTADAGQAAKKWVGVCGGLAAETVAVPLLIGLGIEELSAPSPSIPTLKAAVRDLSLADCRLLAEKALAAPGSREVRSLLKEFQPKATSHDKN